MSNAIVPINQAMQSLDLTSVSQQYNVLGPRGVVSASEGLKLRAVIVQLSANPDDGDVYKSPSGQGKLALSKIGLLKVAEGKGVVWADHLSHAVNDAPPCSMCVARAEETGRPPVCQHNVGFKAVGAWMDATGMWRSTFATRYWLYDEELAEVQRTYREQIAKGWIKEGEFEAKVEAEINKRMRDRMANAETKAKLRVIREIGVRPAYKPDELAKGFLCVRVEADLSPEEVKARASTSAAAIFGPAPASRALPAPDFTQAEDLGENGDHEEPDPANLPSAAADDTPGPWDKPAPDPETKRPALLAEIDTLWKEAYRRHKDKRLETMPHGAPAQDAPIADLEEWIRGARVHLGLKQGELFGGGQ